MNMNINMDMLFEDGHAVWTWTSSMTWTCSMNMGLDKWTCSMYMGCSMAWTAA
jgi:hypothetical protein